MSLCVRIRHIERHYIYDRAILLERAFDFVVIAQQLTTYFYEWIFVLKSPQKRAR